MSMTLKPVTYRSAAEIEALVRAFEQGTLPPGEFNHHAHMTVALWYLRRHPYPEAVDRMRAAITHFAARHHQSQLYNETITLFWMKLLRHVLDQSEGRLDPPEAHELRLGDSQLVAQRSLSHRSAVSGCSKSIVNFLKISCFCSISR